VKYFLGQNFPLFLLQINSPTNHRTFFKAPNLWLGESKANQISSQLNSKNVFQFNNNKTTKRNKDLYYKKGIFIYSRKSGFI